MSSFCKFKIGQTVTNSEIIAEFKCGNMGGMRRSKATNSLIIISDHTKGLYEDKWIGDVLHYTGMGKSGDQDLNFMQNKTLAESDTNGVEVHLFEVLVPTEYIYRGLVTLADKPYQEIQKGEDGVPRKVWMFPLKLKSTSQAIPEETFKKYIKEKEKVAEKLSFTELKNRAEQNESDKVSKRKVSSNVYIRDPFIAEYAKRRANGICDLCDQQAPFTTKEGKPYLECHHIEWLSEGGSDTIENTVALCPNCHRKMHVLNLPSDKEKLRIKAKRR
ncbi:HNH endonuclease [Calidifontibacillus erzurumensis]|uniref:HNH endonuclease n=1 Tax=Calidifontibacillus erzurumensis TaxID=2741433 RepID=A0A8J8KC88_9BACI|nr:HNH endonuclease [Calidifontibacillus erzurumensis]NSL52794.1 HNH endonuclease [Calidifontibacillus erzurumensis]